jgi:hypothetical protein
VAPKAMQSVTASAAKPAQRDRSMADRILLRSATATVVVILGVSVIAELSVRGDTGANFLLLLLGSLVAGIASDSRDVWAAVAGFGLGNGIVTVIATGIDLVTTGGIRNSPIATFIALTLLGLFLYVPGLAIGRMLAARSPLSSDRGSAALPEDPAR